VSDFIICLAGLFASVAPFGALGTVLRYKRDIARQQSPDALQLGRLTLFSPVAAFVLIAIAALVSDPLLDALRISGPSFEFAAAAAMLPLAIRLLVFGDSMTPPAWKLPDLAWLMPFALPLLAGPVSLIAAISYADRFGVAEAIVAAAIPLSLTGTLFATLPRWQRARPLVVQMLGRLSGVLLVAMAAEMVLDGLYSV
jgi:small neutral amino acid transporter SnatA (MarC family)